MTEKVIQQWGRKGPSGDGQITGMDTGFHGTFVISWAQTEVDGIRAAPLHALVVGAHWRWWGDAVRVDGPSGVLVLTGAEGEVELRRRAQRTVGRLIGGPLGLSSAPSGLPPSAPPVSAAARAAEQAHGLASDATLPDEAAQERGFVVTDGFETWQVLVIEVAGNPAQLLVFAGRVPPAGTDLWVVSRHIDATMPRRRPRAAEGVICFTPGTLIDTPDGRRPVEAIRPGDRVWTRDDGAQEVIWTGHRRMSGARLYAMPGLRPLRIRAGALGEDRPDRDLIVSPAHRLLLKGPAARALFGTPEVLVRAADLIDDRRVMVDHSLREVTYVHLLLERHQILRANGIEAESFHPASADLDMIDLDQRRGLASLLPGLEDDALAAYGDFARRPLTAPEAAILRHQLN